MDDDSWNNGTADLPVPLNGADLAEYEGPILRAVESCNSYNEGNLMLCFRKEWNPGVKEKVLSAIPSVEIRGGELMACATVCLKEPLTEAEMQDLQDYLKGQFSDGWGEDFEQQEIQTGDGVLYVHFAEEPFDFTVEQVQGTETSKEQPVPKRPKMKLVGQDGNIFAILGRASRLLKENGQPQQAKEMSSRVYQSGDYYKALNIISEYVETELSEKVPPKQKKRSDRER